MTGDRLSANYVNNYIRPGPSSNPKRGIIVLTDTADVKYYVGGNVVEGRPEWTANNALLFDKKESQGRKLVTVVDRPFETPPVRTSSAPEALRAVLAGVGATLPRRDAVDARIVGEVESRAGSVIDSQWEVGGWPEYRSARPPRDTDLDGIPDEWGRARGLNPQDASDAAAVRPDGYTNLEAYLNGLVSRRTTPPGGKKR